ncbi:MarR family transcriptional regulator [Mycobacterium sp. DL592]|uniref:MarR family transcriptional regulator n=1 Tax=Mycobacterium sp. DL592 TaxID=2675524 RepID=UPI0014221214|nr:MarR family transcriptional regulator [Mycobacterium sp. DL592]
MSDAGLDRWGHLEYLRGLVSRPRLVDLLDVLAAGPMTVVQIRAALGVGRPAVRRALRELIIGGLVTGDTPGSRDGSALAGESYQHTERGRAVVGLLSRFSVWTSLYDE